MYRFYTIIRSCVPIFCSDLESEDEAHDDKEVHVDDEEAPSTKKRKTDSGGGVNGSAVDKIPYTFTGV